MAVVGTKNRNRPKTALGEIAKAHGLEPAKVRELSNELPYAFWMRFATELDGKPTPPFAELRTAYPSPTYQAIFDEAEAILKLPRHLFMDPSGVVVAPSALTIWCRLSIQKERGMGTALHETSRAGQKPKSRTR